MISHSKSRNVWANKLSYTLFRQCLRLYVGVNTVNNMHATYLATQSTAKPHDPKTSFTPEKASHVALPRPMRACRSPRVSKKLQDNIPNTRISVVAHRY